MAKIKINLGQPTFQVADEKFKARLLKKQEKKVPVNCFDFSMLNRFINCHRSFYYRHELNLAVHGRAAPPLVLGGAIHHGLAAHHKLLMEHEPGYTFPYGKHSRTAKLNYVEHIKPYLASNDFPITADNSDGKRYALRGLEILEEYLKCYPREDFRVEEAELPVAVIMPYEYGGVEGEIIYIGVVDAVIYWRGHYYALETKTASRIDRFYFSSFRLSFQVIGYINALRELKGIDVNRALINVIGVYKSQFRFERDRVIKMEDEIKSFQEQIISITREIFWYRARVEQGEAPESVWYQNPGHCFKWSRACQFHPLCSKPTAQGRKMLANIMYGRNVWAPFDII